MKKEGNKVFVLVSPKNRTAYNFRGDLIEQIVTKGYKVYVTGPNQVDVERIEALGAEFVELPNDKNGINVLADIRYFILLVKLFFKVRPSVTLGYTIKPAIYGAIAARLTGVESVNSMITGVGYLFTSASLKARILRLFASILYRVGLKCANHVIFQNPDDRAEFIRNRLVTEKKCYVVNGSGVNMMKFEKSELPEETTFFMLSRVLYSKGIREYLAAVKKVKATYPEVRCMLLGAVENMQDSMKMDDLQPYIDAGLIDYYGETNDVRKFFSFCSVFVLPSYREGTPRTVLEAMAMGKAVITTDVPGCRETVIDGENGFLVPVRDADALADKMIWMIEHSDQIPVMGLNGIRYCRAKFDVEKVNAAMFQIMNLNN